MYEPYLPFVQNSHFDRLHRLIVCWLLCILLLMIQTTHGQSTHSFTTHGEAVEKANCSEIVLSQDPSVICTVYSKGAAWYNQPIDISQPFQLGFIVDILDSMGTSGMAFVLQPDTAELGDFSNNMGWGNAAHKPSIALTFDLKSDSIDNDPLYNHIAIQLRGDTKHHSPNNIAGPVDITPYFQPGGKFYHLIEVSWDPVTTVFAVQMDGNPLLSVNYDLLNGLFAGNKKLYWGFTGAMSQLKALFNQVPPPGPGAECPLMGYMRAYFGTVTPSFASEPALDTCFGRPIRLYDNSLYFTDTVFHNASNAKWFWDFGDGTYSSLQNPPPHIYNSAGYYTIKFAVTNKLGCTVDTLVKPITLASKPVADFDNDVFCANTLIHFKDLSSVSVGTISAWNWYYNGQRFSIDKNPTFRFPVSGTQQIQLHIRSFEGCEADTIRALAIEDKPMADFLYAVYCDGRVFFQGKPSNDTSIQQVQWNTGDGSRSFATSFYHVYPRNGNYTTQFFAVSKNGCVSDTITKVVAYNRLKAFAGNDTIAVKGQPIQLMASGGKHYEWSPAAGLSNVFIANPIAVLEQSTQYTVTVRNDDSCFDNSSINIKVYGRAAIYVPNAFTPNHDGLNDLLRPIAPGMRVVYFKIYNRQGAEIFTARDFSAGWNGMYRGKEMPAGTYVWIVFAVDDKGKSFTERGTTVLIR